MVAVANCPVISLSCPEKCHEIPSNPPSFFWTFYVWIFTELLPDPEPLCEDLLDVVLSKKDRVKMENWGFRLLGREYELEVPVSYEGAAIWDRLIGQYLNVLYDPCDLRRMNVFYKGRYWCDAIPLRRGSFLDDKVMREKIRLQGYQRQFIRDQLRMIRGGPSPEIEEPRLSHLLDWPQANRFAEAIEERETLQDSDGVPAEDDSPTADGTARGSGSGSPRSDIPSQQQQDFQEGGEGPVFIDEASRYLWLLERRVIGFPIDPDDQAFMKDFQEREEYQMLTQFYEFKEEEFRNRK